MTAEEKPELPLTPEEIAQELREAGIVPTLPDLRAMIAAAQRAANDGAVDDWRHRARPLLALTPEFMDEGVPRKWAERGELNAWKIAGRWFSTVADMENWLIRTGRFESKADEERWRGMIMRKFGDGFRQV